MAQQNDDEGNPGAEPTEIHTDRAGAARKTREDTELNFSFDDRDSTKRTTEFSESSDGKSSNQPAAPNRSWIGRYRVEKSLGSGGFGQVYLARDDELRRNVTIKVPHAHRVASAKDVDAFLDEARTLAKLEHANVVPVHDVGRLEDGTCFIVSRYIDGSDLYQRSKNSPLQIGQAIELVATIAEALHYVHSMRVIHRDIKPNNILLDKRGTAYLADFGLALLEEDAARTSRIAGTPAYMSPEQARGENHLVTGKSDIFSLGIVLYELITGRRPFADKNAYSVLRMIQEDEAKPPSELNPEVSPELERVCLKALAKRANARHSTALNLANDLRFLISDGTQVVHRPHKVDAVGVEVPSSPSQAENSQTNRRAEGLVPRGLRSFGTQDSHFFSDLLPGPYDREGVPESILFWKRRIHERDPENTFRVGLIYGPSGCGKSSFCKAGLIPTLDSDVIPIFVEAAPGATETRLLNRIRRKCPYLDTDLGLRESVAALRHQNVMGEGTKVVLIIDQFEQWLYSTQQPEHSDLAKALRQCDGEHVQCILLVRDDFWLAFSRFMEHVEIDLLQNHNMAMIDLFDVEHAKLVLREFGRAFERLPRNAADMSRDENAFVAQAIEGLAEQGKVVPVRIALFAEMIKSRPWSTATLKQIGGTKGVGVLFLEESFSSSNAPAEYAVHLDAVYETLGSLLPKPGTDLKGHMRSRDELLELSGYAEQPKQFQSLIRTLDTELHLITRTAPGGRGDAAASQSGVFSNSRSGVVSQSGELVQGEYYQLAHDYLVPAIREWQVRMQRGTARGRAAIRMSQRAEVWGTRPESRHLPTLPEWLSMQAFTSKKRWSETERKMMRSAGRRHGITLLGAAILLVVGAFGFRQFTHWNQADSLTQQLEVAEPSELTGLLDELEKHGSWSQEPLKAVQLQNEPGTAKHLFSSLALLRIEAQSGEDDGQDQIGNIKPALLTSDPETLGILCAELQTHRSSLVDYLWGQVEDETLERTTDEVGRPYHPRLNALMALAKFAPPEKELSEDSPWKEYSEFAAQELIYLANIDRTNFSQMVSMVQPAVDVLVEPLANVMVDAQGAEARLRTSAAQDLLVRILEERVPEYVDILIGADVELVLSSIDLIDKNFGDVRDVLEDAVTKPIEIGEKNWQFTALRKATAAAILLRHDVTTPDVWAALVPDALTPSDQPIPEDHVLRELERLLPAKHWNRLNEQGEMDLMRQRYAELTFGRTLIPNAKTRLVQRVALFEANPLPMARKLLVEQDLELQIGLIQALGEFEPEALAESLRNKVITILKGWVLGAESAVLRGNAFWLLQCWDEQDWANEQFAVSSELRDKEANWYVNSIGQTMIQLPQHQRDDNYRIEVAAAETTLGQMKIWQSDGVEEFKWSAGGDSAAAGNVTYHECVAFCNWLSREEGLDEDQLCYPDRDDPNDPPARIFEDYQTRTGYRLPMAEEWFYACASGAITDYSFGSGRNGPGPLKYGLYAGFVGDRSTTSWQVGAARPNNFGIFDMYTNVREWANDLDPDDTTRAQLCGFDFRYTLGTTGAEPRFLGWSEPSSSRSFYGFRLFRSRPTSRAMPSNGD